MNIAGWDISLDAAGAVVGNPGASVLSWTVPRPDGTPLDVLTGCELLGPWCAAPRHGRYSWHGITYTVRPGRAGERGLFGGASFELIEQNDASLRLGTVFSSDDYPGVLKVEARYELRRAPEGFALALELTVRNICSEAVPVQLGWRPVIALEGPSDAARVRIPARARVATDRTGLPLAGMSAFEALGADGVDLEGLGDLDDAYTDLVAREGRVSIRVEHASGAHTALVVDRARLGRGASVVHARAARPDEPTGGVGLVLAYSQGMDDALSREGAGPLLALAPGERRLLRASLVHGF